eukprot:365353-Chlamydomonas_euryale.AAC.4
MRPTAAGALPCALQQGGRSHAHYSGGGAPMRPTAAGALPCALQQQGSIHLPSRPARPPAWELRSSARGSGRGSVRHRH